MYLDTLYHDGSRWINQDSNIADKNQATLVLVFGHSDHIKFAAAFHSLQQLYPQAHIIGASSSGNITGVEISSADIIATAIHLQKSHVAVSRVDFDSSSGTDSLCERLIGQLPSEGLKHIMVFSDGLNINGSTLVHGLNEIAGGVSVSGGMAGDGERFEQTWIIADEPARQFRVAAVGFYGDDLCVSTSYNSGWSSFGPQRSVTRSQGNVLYEIDGKPALQLYREYLGAYADELPLSGMRFPLNIKADDDAHEVTRTLLAIDMHENSITFAGDVPEGYIVRLMKPNMDELINGAGLAADIIEKPNQQTALAIVISCVGRRVVMNQMIEDELEEIAAKLGSNVQLCGFYSYGEFAPFADDLLQCQLHNQTIALTALYEL